MFFFIFYFILYLFFSLYQFCPSSPSSTSNPLPSSLSHHFAQSETPKRKRERLNTRRSRTSSSSWFPSPSPSLTPPPSPCISLPSDSHSSQESERVTMWGTTVRTCRGATLEVVLRPPGMKCSSPTMVEMAELWRDGSRERREEEEREIQGYAIVNRSSSLSCSSSCIPINDKDRTWIIELQHETMNHRSISVASTTKLRSFLDGNCTIWTTFQIHVKVNNILAPSPCGAGLTKER